VLAVGPELAVMDDAVERLGLLLPTASSNGGDFAAVHFG
jgi:hypothetical protein